MKQKQITIGFIGVALVAAGLAIVTKPHPVAPNAFFDEGKEFFPDFTDPNAAKSLEVIDYDAEHGAAIPFKVTFDGKKWTIPSEYNYPADGKDRLAKTAAGLIGIKRDDFRTDNPADYAACGVIDPLDESNPSIQGRGKRITIKGENDVVLADIIVGKSFKGRDDFHLVRIPGQKRVYGTQLKLDLSTSFKDWINDDLLNVDKDKITRVELNDYSVDERTGSLNKRDQIVLTRDGDTWNMGNVPRGKEVDKYKIGNLLTAIDGLSINGVRPKPPGVSASLARAANGKPVSRADMLSLQSKGFFFTRNGNLVSNEGELRVADSDGVDWTLRFGEVAVGITQDTKPKGEKSTGENRYVMISASFDSTQFKEPPRPANTDYKNRPDSTWTKDDYRNKGLQTAWNRWKAKENRGRGRAEKLSKRFAGWYYIISSESFDKLHIKRNDLLRDKPKTG